MSVVYTGMLLADASPDIRDNVNCIYIGDWNLQEFAGKTSRRMIYDTLIEFDIYIPAENLDAFRLQKILLHEFGHVYGLEHSSRVDSVMFPSVSAIDDEYNRLIESSNHVLTQDDVTNLYVLQMQKEPHLASQTLSTLNLILPFIQKNTGKIVRLNETFA